LNEGNRGATTSILPGGYYDKFDSSGSNLFHEIFSTQTDRQHNSLEESRRTLTQIKQQKIALNDE